VLQRILSPGLLGCATIANSLVYQFSGQHYGEQYYNDSEQQYNSARQTESQQLQYHWEEDLDDSRK